MKAARSYRVVSLLAAAIAALSGPPALLADDRADQVARELVEALGGTTAWEKARQFRFDFVVEREGKRAAEFRHLWDRYTGDYRVHGADKSGAPYVVYFNVNTREGATFLNGRPVEGEEKKKLLEAAYGRFINDSYWLLAPWKVIDPGVVRAYEGEKTTSDGVLCDVIRLSFEGVGLTPKDVYWLWVTREGRRMVQWEYVLGGAQEAPTLAFWRDWRKFSGVSLAIDRAFPVRPIRIFFENVSVSPTRDDREFAAPASP